MNLKMRWVIGDIHGCLRELERLLRAIRFDPARDEAWSTGDFVRGGTDSAAVLRLWREIGGRGVIGNHDLHACREWAGERPRTSSLASLFCAPDAEASIAWLRQLPLLARLPSSDDDRDVWVVHAGVHPRWDDLAALAESVNAAPRDEEWLKRSEVVFATSVRCCDANGQRSPQKGGAEDCLAPYQPWDDFYRGAELVVHGHWAMRGYYRGPRTLGLDSGCVYGGALTAWCLEEDRIVRVPSAYNSFAR